MDDYIFLDQNLALQINRIELPYPWVNFLTNSKFSVMISQANGGFAWYEAPCKYRLTRYRHNQIPTDTPGFYLYIREGNDVWSPSFYPTRRKEDKFSATHMPGETVFEAIHGDSKATLSFFVPPDFNVLVWDLKIENHSDQVKHYSVFAYTELSQLDWMSEQTFGYYWQHRLRTWYDPALQAELYLFQNASGKRDREKMPLVYFAADCNIESHGGDRDTFIGNYRDEANPIAIENGKCDGAEILSGNPCAALQTTFSCDPGKEVGGHFYLGLAENGLLKCNEAIKKISEDLAKLRDPDCLAAQKRKMVTKYQAHFSHFVCKIPDKDAERQINVWGPLNAIQASLFHGTPMPVAPGIRSIGARDKTQSLMALAYRDPERIKKSLLFLIANQYTFGAMPHSIDGVMDEYSTADPNNLNHLKSDDHLWMIFLAYALTAETDPGWLTKESVPFLKADSKSHTKPATVWSHLMRAIKFTEAHLGEHGLPLMLTGDWNDIIGKFSREGKGESVFVAEQYVVALNRMIELAQVLNKKSDERFLISCCDRQKKALEQFAWNGDRFYRCFRDDGKPVGGKEDRYGNLWINPQSWAVFSGIATEEQKRRAFHLVETRLDTGHGLQLLSPAYPSYPEDTEPFSTYNVGTGENGAVFCHAHTWAILAEAMMGNAEKAWKYYLDILPHHIVQTLGIDRYQSDPIGWVSNIIGPGNPKQGWGNVTRFSGTVAWMNIVATQYLLGIRCNLRGLRIDPCIPAEWDGFEAERDYLGCRVHVIVQNPRHRCHGIRSLTLDGKSLDGNLISKELLQGKEKAEVVAFL